MAPFALNEPVPFHWQNYTWNDPIEVSSAGATSLQLRPQLHEGSVYEIRLKPHEGQLDFGQCDGVLYEVPVLLHWSTTDGALDEVQQWQENEGKQLDGLPPDGPADGSSPPPFLPISRPVVLLVTSPQMAYLDHRFYLSNLAGSLALTSQAVQWDRAALDANVQFYHGASRGRLDLQLEGRRTLNNSQTPACVDDSDPCSGATTDAPTGGQLPAAAPETSDEPFIPEVISYIGVWPSALSCRGGMSPLSPTANVIGRSSVELLDLITQAPALVRAASPDLRITTEFEALPEQVCMGISAKAVSFQAHTRLTDSELDAELRFAVRVAASLDRLGDLSTLSLTRENWLQPMTANELAALGIQLQQRANYQDFYLQWDATYTQQDGAWLGSATLRIHGRTPAPECLVAAAQTASTQPAPRSSGACGRMDSVFLEEEGIAVPPGTRLLEVKYRSSSTDL